MAYTAQPYSSDEDDCYDESPYVNTGVRVRRGSEGYEVKPVNREEMLRRFIDERTSEPGRYNVYEPEQLSVSDEDEVDEDVPLQRKVDQWQATST